MQRIIQTPSYGDIITYLGYHGGGVDVDDKLGGYKERMGNN